MSKVWNTEGHQMMQELFHANSYHPESAILDFFILKIIQEL